LLRNSQSHLHQDYFCCTIPSASTILATSLLVNSLLIFQSLRNLKGNSEQGMARELKRLIRIDIVKSLVIVVVLSMNLTVVVLYLLILILKYIAFKLR